MHIQVLRYEEDKFHWERCQDVLIEGSSSELVSMLHPFERSQVFQNGMHADGKLSARIN